MENEFADDALHGSVDDEDEDEDEDEDDIPQNVREGWAVCARVSGQRHFRVLWGSNMGLGERV